MIVLGIIACFGVMMGLFCLAGWGMREMENNEGASGLVAVGIVFGIICGVIGLLLHCEQITEMQRERAVEIGFGEYSSKGERTINKDVMFIIGGVKEKK